MIMSDFLSGCSKLIKIVLRYRVVRGDSRSTASSSKRCFLLSSPKYRPDSGCLVLCASFFVAILFLVLERNINPGQPIFWLDFHQIALNILVYKSLRFKKACTQQTPETFVIADTITVLFFFSFSFLINLSLRTLPWLSQGFPPASIFSWNGNQTTDHSLN